MYRFDQISMKLFFEIESNRFVALKTELFNIWTEISMWKQANVHLQSVSRSLLSLVPRRNFNDRRLNEPPAGACAFVPRRNKNGRTFAIGRLCWMPERYASFKHCHLRFFSIKHSLLATGALLLSSPCIVTVVLLLFSESLSGSCNTNEILRSLSPAMLCKLCADVCEWPIELSAIDQRRFASRWTLSHGGGFSLVDSFDVFGSVW